MQQFAIIFLSILLEALPFVLIGTIVSSLIEIFVSREWLTEHLPRKSWLAFLIAGLAGIIFPICECAIVPVMRRLVKKGMPIGVAVTFMLATPTINPVVLLSTRFAFLNNLYFPLLRGVFGYLTAVSVGLLITFLSDKAELKTAEAALRGEGADHDCDEDDDELCSCGHNHRHGKHKEQDDDEWQPVQAETNGATEIGDDLAYHQKHHQRHKEHDDEWALEQAKTDEDAGIRNDLTSQHCHHQHKEPHRFSAVFAAGENSAEHGHNHDYDHKHDHEHIYNHDHDHDDDEVCACGHVHATKRDKPLQILKSVLDHTSHELYEVGRFLILGVFISAAMQTFVPKQYFLALSQNPALSIVAMMLLAFVLSLCSEADAFVAASFQGGLPNSAILAFLLFGPMMDIKNMLMLAQGFKMKFIIRLILVIAVVVFIFSSLSAFLF